MGLPYLRRFAHDGRVTNQHLAQAAVGGGGLVATSSLFYLADPRQATGPMAINPFLDTNHDGAIDLATEFVPRLDAILDVYMSPSGPYAIYSPSRALPSLVAQAPRLRTPVLILQGANDANVPARGAPARGGPWPPTRTTRSCCTRA